MTIKKNENLKLLNTFSLDVEAKDFAEVSTLAQLKELHKQYDFGKKSYFVLGEGSNTLFPGNYSGLILKMDIKGREIIDSDKNGVTFRFGAGELWRDIVTWISGQELSGVENMAHIPGTIGGAAVGNIAAYGQVFEDVFVELEALNLKTGKTVIFYKDDMGFKYRFSSFKRDKGDDYVITYVTLRCSLKAVYATDFHSRYKNEQLSTWLEESATPPYKPIDIVKAVTALRGYKLPTMDEYGTCGSFFENSFVSVSKYKELASIIKDLQQYPVDKMDYSRENWEDTEGDEIVKIPAGRLLDELGWKGKWIGNVGTFPLHALCVVTNKKATCLELIQYTNAMRQSVKDAYGIELRSEVVIV